MTIVSTSITKGVQVDYLVPNANNYNVIYDIFSDKVLSCYLMWSDCVKNQNKFYIIQGLVDKKRNCESMWTRYGRVGCNGVGSFVDCNCEDSWEEWYKRKKEKLKKGYTEVEMAEIDKRHFKNSKEDEEEEKGEVKTKD